MADCNFQQSYNCFKKNPRKRAGHTRFNFSQPFINQHGKIEEKGREQTSSHQYSPNELICFQKKSTNEEMRKGVMVLWSHGGKQKNKILKVEKKCRDLEIGKPSPIQTNKTRLDKV